MAFTIAAFAVVAIVALWFTFRYYPEKKATERFFDALVAGDTAKAYQLWKPGPTYAMKDFLADWGPQGYYGPVKSYKILHAKAPSGSNAIAVYAGHFRHGKEPQDQSRRSLGFGRGQIVQFPCSLTLVVPQK